METDRFIDQFQLPYWLVSLETLWGKPCLEERIVKIRDLRCFVYTESNSDMSKLSHLKQPLSLLTLETNILMTLRVS